MLDRALPPVQPHITIVYDDKRGNCLNSQYAFFNSSMMLETGVSGDLKHYGKMQMAAGERACRSCTNQRNCSSVVFVDGANAAFPECFKSPDTPIRYRQLRGLFSMIIRQRLILEGDLKDIPIKTKNIGGLAEAKKKKWGVGCTNNIMWDCNMYLLSFL